MKVAHIIDELPPNGAERLMVDMVTCPQNRYTYCVICIVRGGVLAEELEGKGIPVHYVTRRGKFDIGHVFRLARFLRQQGIKVVHTHLFTADLIGRLAARLAGIRCIYATIHSTNEWKGRLYRFLDNLWARLFSTRVIACTEGVHDVLVNCDGLPPGKVVTINNGIYLDKFCRREVPETLRREIFGDRDPGFVFGIIGRLHEAKGHPVLLEALARIKADGVAFTCLVIGEGELETMIRTRINELGLEDDVLLLGRRSDVPALLNLIDMLMMPSAWEGLPITLLEAMASGTVVNAARVGGIPGVIRHKNNGLLHDSGDVDELVATTLEVIRDEGLRQIIETNALATIKRHYDIDMTAQRYESLYVACGKHRQWNP